MKKILTIAAAAFLTFAPHGASRAEEAAAAENPAGTEQPKKKRPPRKQAEYRSWDQAAAAAEAWGQPIIAYVFVQGDKLGSRYRTATFGNPVFKELLMPNAVYYSCAIPQAKAKGRGRGNARADRDAPAKPDRAAIKESEKAAISRIAGEKVPLPVVAVIDPGGKVLGSFMPDAEDLSFTGFVNELKSGFEAGKHALEINRKVQKALDAEAKKRAADEKRKRK